jgi:hypothetical protein
MKLKIFLIPVLIILIVIIAIWVIYPKFQDLNNKQATLKVANAKLADILDKNNKADILGQSLIGNTDKRNTLLTYIPDQEKEEEIISNLNSLANAGSLFVFGMSVAPVEVVPDVSVEDTSGLAAPTDNGMIVPVAAAKPLTSNFKVSLGVTGTYENIKELLKKIVSLRRFNSVVGLVISKDETKASTDEKIKAEDQASNNNLRASISLSFNYIAKDNSVVNIENSVFSEGSFDMSVVDDIKNKMNTVMNGLTVGAIGLANPFVK